MEGAGPSGQEAADRRQEPAAEQVDRQREGEAADRANAISEWEERTGLLYVPWEERSKLGPNAILPKREPREPVPEPAEQARQEEQAQTQQELEPHEPQEMTDEEAADAFARQAEAELEEEEQGDSDNATEESVGEPADVPLTDGSKAPSPLALAELSPDARMYRKPLEKVGDFGKVAISDTGVIPFARGASRALKRVKGLPADAVVISDTGKMMAATDDSASLLAQVAGVSLRHMPNNKPFAIVPLDDGRAAVQALLSSGYDIVAVSKDGSVTVTQGQRMTKKAVERAAKQRKRFEEDADDALSRDLEERAREWGTSAMMSVASPKVNANEIRTFAENWKSRGGLAYQSPKALDQIVKGALRFLELYQGKPIKLSTGGLFGFAPDMRAVARLPEREARIEYAIHAVTSDNNRVRVLSQEKMRMLEEIADIIKRERVAIYKDALFFTDDGNRAVIARDAGDGNCRFESVRYVTHFPDATKRIKKTVPLSAIATRYKTDNHDADSSALPTKVTIAHRGKDANTSATMSVGSDPAERERAKREMDEVRRK